MSDGSPYQVKWAKRAPLAYQTHIGAGTTDRLTDGQTDGRSDGLPAERTIELWHYVTISNGYGEAPEKVCNEIVDKTRNKF